MNLDQVISQTAQQTGASPDQVRQGVQLVGGFLKGKMPAGTGEQLSTLVGGQTISTPQIAQAKSFDQVTKAVAQYTKMPESTATTVTKTAAKYFGDNIPPQYRDQVKGMLGITGNQPGFMDQAKEAFGGRSGTPNP